MEIFLYFCDHSKNSKFKDARIAAGKIAQCKIYTHLMQTSWSGTSPVLGGPGS